MSECTADSQDVSQISCYHCENQACMEEDPDFPGHVEKCPNGVHTCVKFYGCKISRPFFWFTNPGKRLDYDWFQILDRSYNIFARAGGQISLWIMPKNAKKVRSKLWIPGQPMGNFAHAQHHFVMELLIKAELGSPRFYGFACAFSSTGIEWAKFQIQLANDPRSDWHVSEDECKGSSSPFCVIWPGQNGHARPQKGSLGPFFTILKHVFPLSILLNNLLKHTWDHKLFSEARVSNYGDKLVGLLDLAFPSHLVDLGKTLVSVEH